MSETYRLTIDQVALKAGVSRSVVSRVLNNRPRVSESARRKVLDVVEKYNYRPSSVARSLATDRTFEVCVVSPRRRNEDISNGFLTLIHIGIFEQCIKRGYFVSLTMMSPETAGEINERILNERMFDGYLMITQEVSPLMAATLSEREVPAVLIGQDPSYPELYSIDIDNYDGAYKATSHLIALGHRTIASILGNIHLQESIERRSGYVQALVDHGLEPPEANAVAPNYSEQSGYDIMLQWIREKTVPSAVFCESDAIATGVLLALYENGLRVPDDVAVVGFDDVPGARYTIPPLTTIRQPIYQKGVQAANIIIDLVEGRPPQERHTRLPAELIVRKSCGCCTELPKP